MVGSARTIALMAFAAVSCTKSSPPPRPTGARTPAAPTDSTDPATATPDTKTASTPEASPTPKTPPTAAPGLRLVASAKGPFPSVDDTPGPRLVMSAASPSAGAATTFAEALLDEDGAVPVDDARAAALGLSAPDAVWMFVDGAPCRATVGERYALAYEDASLVLEVGFRLDGCGTDFAPLAHVGPTPPAIRWVAAKTDVSERITKPKRFTHPAAATLRGRGLFRWRAADPDADLPKRKPKFHVRIRTAGPIVELGYAHHWPGPDCEEEQTVDVVLTRRVGERYVPLPPVSEYADKPELVGVLMEGDAPWAVIADERYQLQLGMFDGDTVRWTEVTTGDYHDEDTAFWGWSVLDGYCGP